MDFEGISELIKVMSESKVSKLEITEDDITIKMEKNENKVYLNKADIENKIPENSQLNIDYSYDEHRECKDLKEDKQKDEHIDNVVSIKSPIVGTFYGAPGPDKDNFVDIGMYVKEGDTLCIIEAMKLMNEVQSDANGKVIEVLVKDGDMVEYGQELFKIEKN